jgi:Rrf2 family protein
VDPAIRTLLKREESYAVHALLYLHEHPGAPAARVAADLQTPAAFTAKVLQRLVSTGLVEAKQGRSGGVHLRVPLDQLTLLDVIEAMSGTVIMDTCETKPVCPTQQRTGHCRLNTAWVGLTLQVRSALRAVPLRARAGGRPTRRRLSDERGALRAVPLASLVDPPAGA